MAVAYAAAMTPFHIPRRSGEKPHTTRPTRENPFPHAQQSQNSPPELQEALFERTRALRGVAVGKSLVSVPGARAFHLDKALAGGPAEAFQRGTEFAHLHSAHDGSLHLTLPADARRAVLEAGWGEPHPISGTLLVYGPRDAAELEVVWSIVKRSYDYAVGPT
jgi:Family of unknown function (DUF5519)